MTGSLARGRVPVSVVTGFLGAGKTTLLNRLLRERALSDALVIVNEWGEIGLDHHLVERVDGDVILLASGCLCCSLRGDLVDTLADLTARREAGRIAPFSRIVVETTGLADPGPILNAILAHDGLARRLAPPALVTLVDAVNGAATLRGRPEGRRQVAMADRLGVTKSDLLGEGERVGRLADLGAALRRLNPDAPIFDAAAGEFAAADLLAIDPRDARFLAMGETPLVHAHGHAHHGGIATHSLRSEAPVRPDAFSAFLSLLRAAQGPKLLRVKGLIGLAERPDEPLVLQGVQHILHPLRRLAAWPDSDRATRVVFIVEDFDARRIDEMAVALIGAPRIDTPDAAALLDNPLAPPRAGLLA